MQGIYSTQEAAEYIEQKSGGEITERTVIWYIRDKRGRLKAEREGVLQGDKIGKNRVFTQAQLDEFIKRYPIMSVRGRKQGWRKENGDES